MSMKYPIEYLDEEREELEFVKESLDELDELSEQTARVLKVFDLRLKNLGKIAAPIFKSSEKLSSVYYNAGAAINSLDNTLKYYNVSSQDSAIILPGIQEDEVAFYLDTLKRLHEARDGLSKIQLHSAAQNLKDTEKLISIGHNNMRSYINSKIKKGSKKIDPTIYPSSDKIPTISEDEIYEINQLILQYERTGLESRYSQELGESYAETRSKYINESLSELETGCVEAFKLSNVSEEDEKMSASQKKNPITNFVIMNADMTQQRSNASSMFREYSDNMIKMLYSERELTYMLMPDFIASKGFLLLSDRIYLNFIRVSQKICDYLAGHIYSNFINAIEFQSVCKEVFIKLNDMVDLVSREKFEINKLVDTISDPLNKSFTGLIRTLRSATNKPKASGSGGIYKPTIIAFDLLKSMVGYKGKIGSILAKLGDRHWNESSQEQFSLGPPVPGQNTPENVFVHYLEDYVSAMASMIEIVSKQQGHTTSMFAFQVNNYHFIANSIKYSSELSAVLDEKVPLKYENLTLRNRKALQAIWQSCLATFMSSNVSVTEKLELFNSSFEKICQDLSSFSISDPNLRGNLIQDAIDCLVPKYAKFLEENNVNSKYAKYDVPKIEKKIDETYSSREMS
ncbi:hypothetical protein BB559_001361 [Furculomyces boomerangus]|uniref:Exocyst complex protein EXO70 n=2 Tax=Harpellales TaxID=61421 RepID=A0A2T9Z249_9FUNG|nr:hypothetical protein BB559_001361 [Furculomyces boomerangus]PWA02137.1 hypothetical protein BB558_001738 [Smittium angustum]